MYEKNSVLQLQGDPRICKEGMQKNVRFVGDNARQGGAIIQLDGKFIRIFDVHIIEWLSKFLEIFLRHGNYSIRGNSLNIEHFKKSHCPLLITVFFSAKKSSFFPGGSLVEFIGRFINSRDMSTIERDVYNSYQQVNKQIKGGFRTTFLKM